MSPKTAAQVLIEAAATIQECRRLINSMDSATGDALEGPMSYMFSIEFTDVDKPDSVGTFNFQNDLRKWPLWEPQAGQPLPPAMHSAIAMQNGGLDMSRCWVTDVYKEQTKEVLAMKQRRAEVKSDADKIGTMTEEETDTFLKVPEWLGRQNLALENFAKDVGYYKEYCTTLRGQIEPTDGTESSWGGDGGEAYTSALVTMQTSLSDLNQASIELHTANQTVGNYVVELVSASLELYKQRVEEMFDAAKEVFGGGQDVVTLIAEPKWIGLINLFFDKVMDSLKKMATSDVDAKLQKLKEIKVESEKKDPISRAHMKMDALTWPGVQRR